MLSDLQLANNLIMFHYFAYSLLEPAIKFRVNTVLKTLELKPVPADEYNLKKISGEVDTYRIRISSFRVLYRVYWEKKVIGVAKIERRSDNTYS